MQTRFASRSVKGATELTQFPLTIYCLILVVLLPLLNLVTLLVAGCTIYLATNDMATKAAVQSTYAQALNAMAVESYNFQGNSLVRFAKMWPQGGYTGCGNDLFVLATDFGGAGIQSSAANQPLPLNIDTTKSIYEMQVVSSYTVSPLISLSSIPLLGSIPGLGPPVTLSFTASRPIEHAGGLQTAFNNGDDTSSVRTFYRIEGTAPGVMPPATAITWRTPDIFQKIQAAGQTVVSVNVLIIHSNQPWQLSGVAVQPGQSVWIDTSAVGSWSVTPSIQWLDANGGGGTGPNQWDVLAGVPGAALIGYYGSNPPTPVPFNYGTTGSTLFLVGDTLTNYPLIGSGNLSFMCNDNCYEDDIGNQMVRVIVTR